MIFIDFPHENLHKTHDFPMKKQELPHPLVAPSGSSLVPPGPPSRSLRTWPGNGKRLEERMRT